MNQPLPIRKTQGEQEKTMKRGCNQCGKPLKECGHETLQELMTSKVDMREEIRTLIVKHTSEMLDNPDEYEIYPTTKFYSDLENELLTLINKICRQDLEEVKKDIEIRLAWANWNFETRNLVVDKVKIDLLKDILAYLDSKIASLRGEK